MAPIKDRASQEEIVQLVEAWVRARNKIPGVTVYPNLESKDSYERKLGIRLSQRFKQRFRDDWIQFFAPDVLEIWRKAGVKLKVERPLLKTERIRIVEDWVRAAYQDKIGRYYPSKHSEDSKEKYMYQDLSIMRAQNPQGFLKLFSKDVIEIWEETGVIHKGQFPNEAHRLYREQLRQLGVHVPTLSKISNWVIKTSRQTPGRPPIPLRMGATSKVEKQHRETLEDLHRQAPDSWWKFFDYDTVKIWKANECIQIFNFEMADIDGKIALIDQWVTNRAESEYPYPSQHSTSRYERALYSFVERVAKAERRQDWWSLFPIRTQMKWQDAGIARPVRRYSHEEQGVELVVIWAEAYFKATGLWKIPQELYGRARTLSTEEIEQSRMGSIVHYLKRKYRHQWSQKFPAEIVENWRAAGHDVDGTNLQ
ncbi:MAG: hypothetical protein AB7N80_02800 [Bdellovibrionales bacterium]